VHLVSHDSEIMPAFLEFVGQPLVDKQKRSRGTITFTLEQCAYSNAPELPRLSSSQVEESAHKLDASSSQVQSIMGRLSGAVDAVEAITNIHKSWKPLLDNIEVVVKIASTIAEVMFL
jgi:hypothetical protein